MYRAGGGKSGLTWRLLKDLVDHLPPESACKTAAREELTPAELAALPAPAGHGPWSHSEQLLAAIVDKLGWVVYGLYHSQGGRPGKPKPIPRPGVGKTATPLSPEKAERARRQIAKVRAANFDPERERRMAALAARVQGYVPTPTQ